MYDDNEITSITIVKPGKRMNLIKSHNILVLPQGVCDRQESQGEVNHPFFQEQIGVS